MTRRVCCVCGKSDNSSRKGSFSFFSLPKKHGKLRTVDFQLVERRLSAWKAVIGQNFNRYHGVQNVCSDHFHSGILSLKKKINIAMVR
jgi:hypothetical protein